MERLNTNLIDSIVRMIRAPENPEECTEYYKKIGNAIKQIFSGDKQSGGRHAKHPVDSDGKKICVKCGIGKPVSEFYTRKNGALRPKCKQCWNKDARPNAKPRRTKPRPLEPTPEENAWFFFNNCRAAKRYPTQKFEVARVYRPGRLARCSVCGEITISYGSVFTMGIVCRNCREKELEKIMKAEITETRKKSAILASKFKSELENCKTLGTCDIIHAHHEALIEDSERLTSEFLIKMICGDDKVERYKDLAGVS